MPVPSPSTALSREVSPASAAAAGGAEDDGWLGPAGATGVSGGGVGFSGPAGAADFSGAAGVAGAGAVPPKMSCSLGRFWAQAVPVHAASDTATTPARAKVTAWGAGELRSPRTIAGGFGNPLRVPILTTLALEPGLREQVRGQRVRVDGADQHQRLVRLLDLVVEADLLRVVHVRLLGLAEDLLPLRVVRRPEQAVRQRVFLPLQHVLGRLVDPDPDHREREIDSRFALEQELVGGVRAQLLLALVGRIVFLRQPRLVEVGAARVGAADALAFGAPFPLADGRVVEPEVLVDAQVPLPRRRLRLREQDHELLVLRPPVVLGLIDDVDLVLFLLFQVGVGAPVA